MLVLQGSPPSFVTHCASSAHAALRTQPINGSQNCPGGHAVGPVAGPGSCKHVPPAHLSIVQAKASAQSASVMHPPVPPPPALDEVEIRGRPRRPDTQIAP